MSMQKSQRSSSPLPVVAGLLIQDSKVFVARRKKGRLLEGFWEFPGGKIDAGESPQEALQRELFEELGLKVEVGASLGKYIHRYDKIDIELETFWVPSFTGEIQLIDHDEYQWVPWQKLGQVQLAPADIPFVSKIQIELSR